ncbi:MAG: putative cytosolic protein [Candidatus Moranbacteria bacterium GW2011_GWC2_37_73]|nr:MAG: putative cytosolic protein [Parcubacteria group bacterium GW2011_GWC1_36_108]KKQ00049.1 MAG: putative cytosolic protein [Candidatus Moranbacteria bacterium GW2011_GWD2_36_198]KKQ01208.1 MAG: putative cytosolic protein [Candidatus Moranbacteria bacterium GW2011_GWD1_36_198]KKQ40054.1 MAG: putative cytosolic protein [Candidatus Moranbacteria bacterium GW2011_GWC2_37_73]HAR99526.1 hypothetical protein [Candidatus Moranbacteria bacterium]
MKIYEPKRALYRKNKPTTGCCQFCDKKTINEQQCLSLESKHWMVVVNKYPYMDGNVMIIPKRHVRNVADLLKDEWFEFQDILEKTMKKLSQIFKTEDFNIGANIGIDAGGSIEHLHWQIIPRRKKISNSVNIFADIEVITILPEDLRKIIDKNKL